MINELDSDQVGTDAAEFIEIYDGGVGNTSLIGHVLVFYNGGNDLSYFAINLTGSTNAQGYYTVGNTGVSGVDQTFSGNFLQNGQDAVALYVGSASAFPNGTAITTSNLLDAVVYDTGQADDASLLVLLNSGQPQVNENTGSASATNSIQRCPNGTGGARNTSTYATFAPTPDAMNTCGVAAIPVWKTLFAMLGIQVAPGANPHADRARYFFLRDASSNFLRLSIRCYSCNSSVQASLSQARLVIRKAA